MANQKNQSGRFGGFFNKVKSFFARIWSGLRFGGGKTRNFIVKHPFPAFFSALAILIILIILGNTIFKPKPVEEKPTNPVKTVHTFNLGTAPKVTVQGKVEKGGVIQIVAQMGGIVNSVNVNEGTAVYKGQVLVNLATNYQGGNALSLSRQIAQNQNDLAQQTYDEQKQTIEKNREVAQKTDENSDQLRDIQNQSLDESRSLLDLNDSIVASLNSNLQQLEASGSGTANSAAVLQTQSSIAQTQAGINQLRSAIRNTEYTSASDRPPAQLSDLQREITLSQLDVQEKSLEMNKQIAQIQYQLALVNEANMYPATPFAGTVERVFVSPGQSIKAGDVLAVVTASSGDTIKVDALVGESVAKNLSVTEDSQIVVNNKTISMHPNYISTEATSGQLYSVIFVIDDSYSNLFTDGSYVSVSLPVGTPDSSGIVPFVPIDSVFQTQDEADVYVVQGNKAVVKKVTLGDVQGRFVAVTQGLGQNDQVITDRNVVDGDQIEIAQ